jgi:ATP-dependent DNA helicase
MAFRGLFIGIDRYASTEITWLSCAQRDAMALHALCTDTLGGEAILVTDGVSKVLVIGAQLDVLAASTMNL